MTPGRDIKGPKRDGGGDKTTVGACAHCMSGISTVGKKQAKPNTW